MNQKNVLLVDDEEEFVKTLATRLESRGFKAETAGDGTTAIKAVQGKVFDAIVLDLAMPGMDGIETLKRLREHNPEAQVIVLTGQATVKKATEAMRLGALDVLEKPVDIVNLVDKIVEAGVNRSRFEKKHLDDDLSDIMRRKGW